MGGMASFCGSVLSFFGGWLMMILSGDMARLRAAVYVVGMIWMLFKFIASVPQMYRWFSESSHVSSDAGQPPLVLIGIMVFVPVPLLIGSCRAAFDAVARANRSRAKLTKSREKWEAERKIQGEEAKLKAKAGAVQSKRGKKGRIKY